jgi:hypothetical protein
MASFEFRVVLDRLISDPEFDVLYEAGLDDCGLGNENGTGVVDVDREAANMAAAVQSVVAEITAAGFQVVAVEDEDLVGRATIATRLGVSPQYVHLLATGKRGPGGFPVVESGDGWALYSWTQVAQWARQFLNADVPVDDNQRTLALADHLLRARALARPEDRQLIKTLIAA